MPNAEHDAAAPFVKSNDALASMFDPPATVGDAIVNPVSDGDTSWTLRSTESTPPLARARRKRSVLVVAVDRTCVGMEIVCGLLVIGTVIGVPVKSVPPFGELTTMLPTSTPAAIE